MRKSILGLAALGGLCAFGATTLYDFEAPGEIAKVPKTANANWTLGVTNAFATCGANALHFKCATWKRGMPEWPSFTVESPVADWTPYDRLVVDVVTLGARGDLLSTFIAEKDGRIQNGLQKSFRLPSAGLVQWVIPLKDWPQTADPRKIARIHFFTERPGDFDVYLDRWTLLKRGEAVPAPTGAALARDLLPSLKDRVAAAEQARTDAQLERDHLESYWRFREKCSHAGQDTSRLLVGAASPMVKIRPRGTFDAEPACEFAVRLARNEKESVQVLVAPGERDLRDARVSVGDLVAKDGTRFAAANVKCALTGYVNVTNRPPYKVGYATTNAAGACVRAMKTPEAGWWPDPILDHMSSTDVRGRDVQSFWVRVTCPETQKAGDYAGTLTVSVAGKTAAEFPFRVRVNDFAVPKASPLPMAITFWPEVNTSDRPDWQAETAKLRNDPDFPVNAWKPNRLAWGDFLADYYVTMDSLYGQNRQQWDVLARLDAQGRLGVFNLGYWSYPAKDETDEHWRARTLPTLKANYEKAKALGILDKAYLYGCDEISKEHFPSIKRAVACLKKEFPGVPISTTAYDHEFGVGTELGVMDWFTPLTPKFDVEKAAKARKEGRQVWWYICCGPHSPYANMFIENAAIEGRILMGAQTTRMRPDGFLYYEISIWNMRRPLSCGPFTDWDARSWTTYHGDGSWTCIGPGGRPLATQRLENFRDGLEDYAYALELERRLKACTNPDGPWAAKARAALAVPDDVMTSMTDYTDDPAAVMRWRDAMADLIESSGDGRR